MLISTPFFFWPKDVCRFLCSLTRLGPRPSSEQKALLGMKMMFVLEVRALPSGSDKDEGRSGVSLANSPRIKWQNYSLTPSPRPQEGVAFCYMFVHISRGVLLALCHGSSLAFKSGGAVQGLWLDQDFLQFCVTGKLSPLYFFNLAGSLSPFFFQQMESHELQALQIIFTGLFLSHGEC